MQYIAYYEDAARVEAAAKERGFTGNDGESWHDFVDVERSKFRRAKLFRTLSSAVEWLKAEINANKSVYGQGTISLQEPIVRRCRACTCGGLHEIHEYVVDETGIVEDRDVESVCLD